MIRWCGEDLPWEAAKFHFLVTGATGSGKTALLRVLLQSVLGGEEPTGRALIYDPKQDFLPILDGILRWSFDGDIEDRLCILNPFDVRGVQWDIASDITNPAAARQIAATLVPEDPSSASPFFARAAQDIAYGVILSFITTQVPWTFRDLILALTTGPELTKQILELTPANGNRLRSYFGTSETNQSVWSTLQTKVSVYEPIAAGFDCCARAISLSEWVKGHSAQVLMLRTNQSVREPIDAFNAVIFRRLSELILDLPDLPAPSPSERIWVFLDECREAGRLDGLRSLLNMGRSKGATVVLSFQDIDGIKAVYGDHEALELTGQCGNKALLRLESPATAAWCSSIFGEERVVVTDSSSGVSAGSGAQYSSGESSREVDRPRVLASRFFAIPAASESSGVHGIAKRFDQPGRVEFHMKPFPAIEPSEVSEERRRQKLWKPSEIEPVWTRLDRDLFLEPWSGDDMQRLGLESPRNLDAARRPRAET